MRMMIHQMHALRCVGRPLVRQKRRPSGFETNDLASCGPHYPYVSEARLSVGYAAPYIAAHRLQCAARQRRTALRSSLAVNGFPSAFLVARNGGSSFLINAST